MVLPRIASEDNPTAQVALKEGVVYPQPTHHYETEQIQELHELVERVLDGEDLFAELEEHLEAMARNYEFFESRHIGPMQELLVQESGRFPDDDYNTQLSYVLRTGMDRFKEGRDEFKVFFETESDNPDELEEAFTKVGDGHDYICLGLEMAQTRLAALENILEEYPEEECL